MKKKQPLMKLLKLRGRFVRTLFFPLKIIIIALGELTEAGLLTRIISLSVVGIGITIFVYGLVALIVRADDFGLYLIKKGGVAKSIGNGNFS